MQLTELWTQCFVWWEVEERAGGKLIAHVGVCTDRRLGFGGAFAPNRFERVSLLVAALTQRMQAAFDLQQPPPRCVQRWTAESTALQQQGLLLAGEAQINPRYIQAFIDDINGVAMDDEVSVPPELTHIHIGTEATIAAGGTPAAENVRAHVHARIGIAALRRVGLEEAEGKTTVGSPIISLGLLIDRDQAVVRCPEAKRAIMMAQLTAAEEVAVAAPPRVVVAEAERLVGRACNLSQVLPELTATLHGGYRITCASQAPSRRWRVGQDMRLKAGSTAHVEWLEFLRVTRSLLRENEGVALAPQLVFPSRLEGTTLTSTTDASGVDGVGGYVFSASRPEDVWVVSEWWPADVLEALQAAGERRGVRRTTDASSPSSSAPPQPILSMPAAELFGAWAVPRAAIQAGAEPGPVYAIGDCDAAVGAINAANSGVPQMFMLTRAARRLTAEWLGVSVGREANLDADRLSHPQEAEAVMAEAAAAGMRVTRAHIDSEAWATLRQAIAAGGRGAGEREWRG